MLGALPARRRWERALGRVQAAGLEGSAAGLQIPPIKHISIPRIAPDQASVDRNHGMHQQPSVGGHLNGGTNGAAHAAGGVDIMGAMFLERISSNGSSSSSNGSGEGFGSSDAPPRPRLSRHERHLMRRREQGAGRRGSRGAQPPGFDQQQQQRQDTYSYEEDDSSLGLAFGETSGRPQQGWAPQRRPASPPSSSQDAFLDSFISRLLSPQHDWGQRNAQPAVASPPLLLSDEPLPPETLESVPTMAAGNGASLFANLARAGKLRAALQLLEAAVAADCAELVVRCSHRHFLRAAAATKSGRMVLRFLQVLPPEAADGRTYNLALHACVDAADLETATSIVSLMNVRSVPLDVIHRTTLIAVSARALNLGAAFKYYTEARQVAADAAAVGAAEDGGGGAKGAGAGVRLDGWVYGALVAACAAGIKAAGSDRKEQLVLLTRAFGVLEDAEASHVHLEAPVWNALLMCAGGCVGCLFGGRT